MIVLIHLSLTKGGLKVHVTSPLFLNIQQLILPTIQYWRIIVDIIYVNVLQWGYKKEPKTINPYSYTKISGY